MGLVNYIHQQNARAVSNNENIIEDNLVWEPTPALRWYVTSEIKREAGIFSDYTRIEHKTLQMLWEARASDSSKNVLRSEWRDVPKTFKA